MCPRHEYSPVGAERDNSLERTTFFIDVVFSFLSEMKVYRFKYLGPVDTIISIRMIRKLRPGCLRIIT